MINADKGVSAPLKLAYLFLNFLDNNLFPNASDKDLIIKEFAPNISDADWKNLSYSSSPSRRLSELFWLKLPWEAIKRELGEICVLDVGCGSGNHGARLQIYSGNRITSYKGVDIKYSANWDLLSEKYKNFRFEQVDSKDILKAIPDETNLITSQSAIEHFEEDLTFFAQVREFIKSSKKDVIQIHLFPSSACLKLYLWHGIRQYTPRTVSKITRLFRDFSYSVLFKLGGENCNKLHFKFITKPYLLKREDLRNIKTEEYENKLFEAIKKDSQKTQKTSSFFALVIHSNWKERIFLL